MIRAEEAQDYSAVTEYNTNNNPAIARYIPLTTCCSTTLKLVKYQNLMAEYRSIESILYLNIHTQNKPQKGNPRQFVMILKYDDNGK